MSIDREEAERLAQYELRFQIGNRPRLSDPEYDAERGGYVFKILFTKLDLPDLPDKDPYEYERDDGGEVEFHEAREIGEMVVLDNGDIERTDNETLGTRIQEVSERAENGEIPKRTSE